jgi:hypothetical protein
VVRLDAHSWRGAQTGLRGVMHVMNRSNSAELVLFALGSHNEVQASRTISIKHGTSMHAVPMECELAPCCCSFGLSLTIIIHSPAPPNLQCNRGKQ